MELEDEARTGLAVRDRDQLRRMRMAVVQRGLHHNRFVGPGLRWIGRHTP